MKKTLSFLLALLLVLFTVVPSISVSAEDSTGPEIYFIYADIQAEQTQIKSDYSDYCFSATSWRHQLPTADAARGVSCDGIFYLAQNEREGIQIYLTNPGEEAFDIQVEVSEFRNANDNTLSSEIFKEEYVSPNGTKWYSRKLYIADPLLPYKGEKVTVEPDNNQAFYIETRSTAEQEAGAYYATVTFSDDNGIIATKTIAAIVWDFALPQQHYGKVVMGLYNASSGYEGTMSFLKQNGVRTYTYTSGGKTHEEILPEDKAKAEKILEGWDEYLLDHGITPLELPRYMIDEDEKSAELAMADVRRKYFSVPLQNWYTETGTYDAETLSVINHYKSVIGDNDYLRSKAFLYSADEVNATQYELINSLISAGNSAWPEVKKLFSYNGKGNSGTDYSQAMSVLDPYNNYVCFNTTLLTPYYTNYYSESLSNDYYNNYPYKWRYPCEMRTGGFELWLWRNSSAGIYRRLPFWQQHNNNEDCLMYWNCGYIANNYDIWGTKELPSGDGTSTGNGNGLLLYPGDPIGEDPCTPIGSLRIKQIASGLDDEDYLYLADEFLPEADRPTWKEKSDYWWTRCDDMTNNRISLGNKLEKAAVEHEFGEWHTVVEPDRMHTGLQIRECILCGTEESTEIAKLPSYFTGHSLSLNGDIGVNFYLDLTEEEAADTTVSFAWEVEGKEKTSTSELTLDSDTGYYKAACPIPVAEMTYDITAALNFDQELVDTDTYSAVQYADVILADQEFIDGFSDAKGAVKYWELATLVKSMLDYGAKAQTQFYRDENNLANKKLVTDDQTSPYYYVPSAVDANAINTGASNMTAGLPDGLTYKGSTIVYLTQTSIRHYYQGDLGSLTVTFDGNEVDPVQKGDEFYFELKNISASNLDSLYTLKIGNTEYKYSVLDYVKTCLLSDKTSDDMKALAEATYRYNQAANTYFG